MAHANGLRTSAELVRGDHNDLRDLRELYRIRNEAIEQANKWLKEMNVVLEQAIGISGPLLSWSS